MRKILFSFLALFILISMLNPVYADDEASEESITEEEIEEILNASTELDTIPTINSRNAVVYDRTSRRSFIWKGRKYKVQNGVYD